MGWVTFASSFHQYPGHFYSSDIIREGTEGRPYFYRNRTPGEKPPEVRPTAHDTTELGLGLVVGSEAMFLPFSEMENRPSPFEIGIGGQEVVVHFQADAMTAWSVDREGNPLVSVLAYRSGWFDFYPESTTLPAPE